MVSILRKTGGIYYGLLVPEACKDGYQGSLLALDKVIWDW